MAWAPFLALGTSAHSEGEAKKKDFLSPSKTNGQCFLKPLLHKILGRGKFLKISYLLLKKLEGRIICMDKPRFRFFFFLQQHLTELMII